MSTDGTSSPAQTIPITGNMESKEERSYEDPSKVRSSILTLPREISALTAAIAEVGKTALNLIAVTEAVLPHHGFTCSALLPSDAVRSQLIKDTEWQSPSEMMHSVRLPN